MAGLYSKHAKEYSTGRPAYPEELFRFIASKTPTHDLAWDVGTGNGQAAKSLADIYKNVVATDTSEEQLELAVKLPNIRYYCSPPIMSLDEVKKSVANESSVDLVAVANSLQWFDLPSFYQQVKYVLKKPNGVVAVWGYPKLAEIATSRTDLIALVQKLYFEIGSHLEPQAQMVIRGNYTTLDFPFQPVDGLDNTGPFEFKTEKWMDLDGFFAFVKSLSAYQSANDKGVEILNDGVVHDFACAWSQDGNHKKLFTFPINLRIGKVG